MQLFSLKPANIRVYLLFLRINR